MTSPHRMYACCLFLAPLLQTISGFFWKNNEYGATGGTLLVLSTVFWIPGLIVLFNLVKDKMPNYAAWGLLISIAGFISGANFGFLGVMADVFNISHEQYLTAFKEYPVSSNILLFQSGPLAPLSLVVLGIVLLTTKSIKPYLAVLIIAGGASFPIGRILRNEWITHLSDLLLLVPLFMLGIRLLKKNQLTMVS